MLVLGIERTTQTSTLALLILAYVLVVDAHDHSTIVVLHEVAVERLPVQTHNLVVRAKKENKSDKGLRLDALSQNAVLSHVLANRVKASIRAILSGMPARGLETIDYAIIGNE